ncbi:MAG: 4Fe-4S ferredoxin [Chloroflexi bacterium]|nr:4Fe-4S ferredoxin [Chloroflexota bacterium]
MPKAVLDETRCQPSQCPEGRCLARRHCPVKALWQEEPFATPFLSGGKCNGCAKCVPACPPRAIIMR